MTDDPKPAWPAIRAALEEYAKQFPSREEAAKAIGAAHLEALRRSNEQYREAHQAALEWCMAEYTEKLDNIEDRLYRTRPPPPFLRHIWEDSTGLLWAYTQVPDPMWEPGLAVRMTPEWGRRTFDTVVEAIDLELGRVVARGRSDELLGAVCGSRLMYLIVETEMGNNRVVVVDPIVIGSIEGGAEEAW